MVKGLQQRDPNMIFALEMITREPLKIPVFTKKWQSDANFEKLTEFLLANVDWLVPAFGSHNIRSIAHAMA